MCQGLEPNTRCAVPGIQVQGSGHSGRPVQQMSLREHMCEVWCQWNIPTWRGILQVATAAGDERRVSYARWMLREVLEAGDGEDLASPPAPAPAQLSIFLEK